MNNVLLITADQWRGDCLGAAGHPLVKTPNLDELAAHSVRFEQHYAGASPCSPARACLYTGLYQMNNRVCINGSPLDRRHDTLALGARRAGYDPILFGYTDQAVDPRTVQPNDPALLTYEELLPGFRPRLKMDDDSAAWLGWLKRLGYQDHVLNTDTIHYPESGVSDPPVTDSPKYRSEHTQTAFVTEAFMHWLDEQRYVANSAGNGWFSHVSFLRPHPPFCVPEPYNSMYPIDAVPDFEGCRDWRTLCAMHPYLEFEFNRNYKNKFLPGVNGRVIEWDDEAFRTIAAIYYGMITEVDAQIGRITNALKQNGYWENTIIIFTSDHGEMLGDHCQLGKSGFFDQSYHIPLLIRDPSAADGHGIAVKEFTESVDVFPTLMSLIKEPVPIQLDGCTLTPLMSGGQLDRNREYVHWEFDFRDVESTSAEQHFGISSTQCNLSVIRNRKYKYVHFAAMPPLLFNLEDDPLESVNLAEQDDYQSIRLQMAEALLAWRAEHLDQSLALTKNY